MKKNLFAIFIACVSILFVAPLFAEEEVYKTSVKDLHYLCTASEMSSKRENLFDSLKGPLRIVITDDNLDKIKLSEAFKEYNIRRSVILDLTNIKPGNGMRLEQVYSHIEEIIFPDSFSYFFENVRYLRKVRIPRTQKVIEMYQFERCPNLREIEVPEGSQLEKIEWMAFHWSGPIEKMNFPPSLQFIYEKGFKSLKDLKELNLPNIVSIDGESFSGCESLERVTLGEKFETLGNTFTGCTNLKEITVQSPKIKFKSGCFNRCPNLENINLPEDCNYKIQDGVLMDKDQRTIIYALPNCKVETFRIPDSVIQVEQNAFAANRTIKKVTNIPELNKPDYAFAGMKNLEAVEYRENVAYPGGGSIFKDCTSLKTFTFPKGTKALSGNFFAGCTSLDNITLPEGMNYPTALESWADQAYGSLFLGCTSLKNVKLPQDIPAIYSSMFSKSGIEKIYIPDSVTVIRYRAFSGCEKLSAPRLPPELLELRDEAFADCTSLTTITLPAKLKLIGNKTFKGCKNITSLVVPDSVVEIGTEFTADSGIKEIVLPKGVKKLSTMTFANSPALKTIKYTGTVEDFKKTFTHDSDDVALDITVHCSDRDFNLLEVTKYYTEEELKKL